MNNRIINTKYAYNIYFIIFSIIFIDIIITILSLLNMKFLCHIKCLLPHEHENRQQKRKPNASTEFRVLCIELCQGMRRKKFSQFRYTRRERYISYQYSGRR